VTGGRTPAWLGQASTGKGHAAGWCGGRRSRVRCALGADRVRVWPALPVPLPVPCPPQLIELAGYTGAGRLVALWWSPYGDELMISDGAVTEAERWRGWLGFCGHPLARLFLEPYRLATPTMRVTIGCSSTGIWERSISGWRAMSSSCSPRSPRSFTR